MVFHVLDCADCQAENHKNAFSDAQAHKLTDECRRRVLVHEKSTGAEHTGERAVGA